MDRGKGKAKKLDARSHRRAAAGSILVLHGPNLNLLGTREPHIYGRDTLADINRRLTAQARAAGAKLTAFQSNHEGALIDRVHAARGEGVAYILINPGGLTHTSVALRDAFSGTAIPFVEIHLSNIHAREPFRQHSYFSDKAIGTVAGLGSQGYELALAYVLKQLEKSG
jgi:3-dehydroquinate dehydratase II